MDEYKKIPLIAVVGPTASGKTALSVALAKQLDGEIINADSMQIYKELNIATAKPTLEERQGIVHHMMDIISPEASYSVSDYATAAREVIAEVASRGKTPILVGGTGLYYSTLLDHVQFDKTQPDHALRERLTKEAEADNGATLYARLIALDPIAAKEIHPHNTVRLVRAMEAYETTGKTLTQLKEESKAIPSPYDATVIGLTYRDRQTLYHRIDKRVDLMMEEGLLQEAETVLKTYRLQTAFHAIGYKELLPYFEKQATLLECVAKIKQESRRYAKRQLTWFRRDQRIHWIYVDDLQSFDELIENCKKILEKSHKA